MANRVAQVVVVGAGITGLACAHRLRSQGRDVLLVEASSRAGGVVETVARDSFEFEAGPNTLLATSEPLWELIDELGMRERIIEASPAAKRRYVLVRGRLLPVPAGPLSALTSPLLGPIGLAGVLRDLFVGRGTVADESVASFVARRFGRRVLDNLVAPFLSGVYAGDAERLEARSILKRLVEAEDHSGSVIRGMLAQRREARRRGEQRRPFRSITFRGGLATFIDRLAESLGPNLMVGSAVMAVALEGGTCRLELANGATVDCQRVVLATGPQATAAFVSGLPGGSVIADDLSAIPQASVAVVGLTTAQDAVGHGLDGFGFLRGPDGPGTKTDASPLLGCLFRSTIFPHTAPAGMALLTCFLGGSRHDISGRSDQWLAETARREVSGLLGIRGEARVMFFRRWREAIPQMERGHSARAARIVEWSRRGPVSIASSAVHGVSLPVCIGTGRAEADRLAALPEPSMRRPMEVQACVPA